MWPVYVIGGAIIVGKILFGNWAEQQQQLTYERKKREQEQAALPRVDLAGARAFWQSQLHEVGTFHIKGMPNNATLLAEVSELSEDHYLTLLDGNGDEVVRVRIWDVESYENYNDMQQRAQQPSS